jgi:hypothetical protein
MMSEDEYEAETIRRALAGDHDAGREALRLCRAGLDHCNLSRPLTAYLAERLWRIDQALDEAEKLREVKQSSGSIRSARDAAIAEALCIKRPAKKPEDKLPEWQVPYAAFGTLLLKAGMKPEQVKASMDEARRLVEKKDAGLHRREAEKILAAYAPMRAMDDELLRHMTGPLRDLLPTHYPQAKR